MLIMKNKKAGMLFKYLRDFKSIGIKQITNIKDLPKESVFSLKGISKYKILQTIKENINDTSSYIFKIEKPNYFVNDETETSELLKGFLENNDEKFLKKLNSFIEKRYIHYSDTSLYEILVRFKKLEFEVPEQYRDYLTALNERKIYDGIYKSFFEIKQKLLNEDEMELVIATGFITDKEDKDINYPLIQKKVSISLDERSGTIYVHDLEEETVLNYEILKKIKDVDLSKINSIANRFLENIIHPLESEKIDEILKEITNSLTYDSFFGVDKESRINVTNDIYIIFKKKSSLELKMIDEVCNLISEDRKIPNSIKSILGQSQNIEDEGTLSEKTIHERLSEINGETEEILFAKSSNYEQLQIAKIIEKNTGVYVQGPPGTGKTHTIANLIGNFLSEGKTILITSHTKKALSVIKEMLPASLQNLTVSLIEEDRSEISIAIDKIQTSTLIPEIEYKKNYESLETERNLLRKELNISRENLFNFRKDENEYFIYEDKSYSLTDIAHEVAKYEYYLPLIKGEFNEIYGLPLEEYEIKKAYKLSYKINKLDLIPINIEHQIDVLNEETLHKLRVFNDENGVLRNFLEDLSLELKPNGECVKKGELRAYFKPISYDKQKDVLASLENLTPFQFHIIKDIYLSYGSSKSKWNNLYTQMKHAFEEELNFLNFKGFKEITVKEEDSQELRDSMEALRKNLDKPNLITKISKKHLLAKESLEINGREVVTAEDISLIFNFLDLEITKGELSRIWDFNLKEVFKKGFEEFGGIRNLKQIFEEIHISINIWHVLEDLTEALISEGIYFLDKEMFFEGGHTELKFDKMMLFYKKSLSVIMHISSLIRDTMEVKHSLASIIASLKNSGIRQFIDLSDALYLNDYEKIKETLYIAEDVHKCAIELNELNTLLENIDKSWAVAIKENKFPIDEIESIDFNNLWKIKFFEAYLTKMSSSNEETLKIKIEELEKRIQKITVELIENKALFHLTKRINEDKDLRINLNSYKNAQTKIGKGFGKNAPKFKKEAKESMKKCQRAVPVWIMSTTKVVETMNAKENKFDVIIIDEASQCDISNIAIMYMAKKVVIVGDDEQVSPSNIGFNLDDVNKLMDLYINKNFDNPSNFDPLNSLFDVAKIYFKGVVLKEHFRSVPEIIGYSNRLSYDNQIKPLKESSGTFIPAIVLTKLYGTRALGRKVNEEEALFIAYKIKELIQLKDYEDKTFGVISLLGEEQVKFIWTEIFKQFSGAEIEKHKIEVGLASKFQGDERDVIFLSLVDSASEGDILRLLSPDARLGEAKKRYNVAVSRARLQLFIAYSFNHETALSKDDIRYDLLSYAYNPREYLNSLENIKNMSDSIFEEEVALWLKFKGYNFMQQYEVGAYRIDFVVIFENNRIAIEVDGESYHSTEEQILRDVGRQMVLERIGWRFIRLRGYEYFRNKGKAFERLEYNLSRANIFPEIVVNSIN